MLLHRLPQSMVQFRQHVFLSPGGLQTEIGIQMHGSHHYLLPIHLGEEDEGNVHSGSAQTA
jgi:hypothetical protein